MPKKIITILFASLLIFSVVLSACAPKEPEMDVSGTNIQFWHVYGEGDSRKDFVVAIADEFNSTNEYGITVEALEQGSTSDLEDKINASIQSGDLPNVSQGYTSGFTNWNSVDIVVDLNQFLYDETYGLTEEEIADIYPGLLDLLVAPDGTRLGWPLSQSSNAMVYNITWAQELGFDSPPTTLEGLKEQLCAAAEANLADDNPDNDGGTGIVWNPSTSNFISLLHAFGQHTVLNEDGTGYDFNTSEAKAVAMYVNELRDAGCTFETESYPNPEQANRLALITTSSTSGLAYYGYAYADGSFPDDEWGFLAFPGPDGGQGVDSYTQTIGVFKSTPEQELASWLFIKFLTSPANQARWVEASNYLPTQYSTEGMLTDYLASVVQYQSTLALAALGQGEPETFPAWYSVRRALEDAVAQMYAAETPEEIDAILAELNITAAELVAEIE